MKKILTILALLIVLPSIGWARERASGYCSQGGHVVVTQGLNSTNDVQESYPSCTVTVYDKGTSTLSTIYADNSGTVKGNPFTSDANGYWFFYADNGRYDVHFSNSSIAAPFTEGDWLLCDPEDTSGSFLCSPQDHNLLSNTHLDTIAGSPPARGSIITAQNLTSPSGASPAWAELPLGPSGYALLSDGIDAYFGPIPAPTLSQSPCGGAANALFSTFCGGPLPATSPFSASLVQSANKTDVASGAAVYLRGPVTAGDKFLVLVTGFCYPGLDCAPTSQAGSDITDSFGDTFSFVGHQGSRYYGTDAFVATASQSGYPSFQAALAVDPSAIAVFEFSDLGAFDATGQGSTSSSGIYSASITTLTDNDTLVAINATVSTGSSTDGLQIDPGQWTTVPLSHIYFGAYATIEYATSFALTAGGYSERVMTVGLGGLNASGSTVIFAFKPSVSPRPTYAPPRFRYQSVLDVPLQLQPLYGLSSSLGGSALSAGACSSTTVPVPGAYTSMDVHVTPETDPGDGFFWNGYVSSAGVVTVRVCAAAAGTPAASFYDVRVER